MRFAADGKDEAFDRDNPIPMGEGGALRWAPPQERACARCHQSLHKRERNDVNVVWRTWDRLKNGEWIYLHKKCSNFNGQDVFLMEELRTFFPPWKYPWETWIGESVTAFIRAQWNPIPIACGLCYTPGSGGVSVWLQETEHPMQTGEGRICWKCMPLCSEWPTSPKTLQEWQQWLVDEREKRPHEIPGRRKKQAGAYVVQLLDRSNTVKIGCSRDLQSRLKGIRTTYGPLRPILLIPHADPATLERQLHARFAPMRQYDGASPTELFVFATRAAQKALELFVQEQAAHQIESLAWTPTPAPRSYHDARQGQLFAL